MNALIAYDKHVVYDFDFKLRHVVAWDKKKFKKNKIEWYVCIDHRFMIMIKIRNNCCRGKKEKKLQNTRKIWQVAEVQLIIKYKQLVSEP